MNRFISGMSNTFLVVLSCLLFSHFSYAQASCGVIHKTPLSENLTEEELSGSYLDRFGNQYTKEELIFDRNQASNYKTPINTGYFNLSFNDFPETITTPGHPNFGEDVRPIICQVFADLAVLIKPRESSFTCGNTFEEQMVNINITDDICGSMTDCDGATTAVAGTATPYFAFFDNLDIADCHGIVESTIWKKINAEETFYPDISSDGLLALNLENISFNFTTDLDNPVPSDKLDLYSIVLHEALHILGFASRIDSDGEPINAAPITAFYSRYDLLMGFTDEYIADGMSENVRRLLDSDCSRNCHSLHADMLNFQTVVEANCEDNLYDVVIGSGAIAAIAGTAGGTVDIANGLSHLRETCNGGSADYVMDPTISKGDDERTISVEELQILCEMGYDVQSPEIDCGNCFAFASDDHVFSSFDPNSLEYMQSCCYTPMLTKIGEPIIIDFNELLCNDFYEGNVEISDVFLAGWGPATLTDLGNNEYEFLPQSKGIHRGHYTIKTCDCYMSTATFEVLVSASLPECDTELCDNLICNGTWSDVPKTNNLFVEQCHEDVFYMEVSNQNTPDICERSNNKFLDLLNIVAPEATLIPLEQAIPIGCTMEIKMDMVARTGTMSKLNIYGSNTKPCHPSEVLIKQNCNPTQNVSVVNTCTSEEYVPYCLVTDFEVTNQGGNSMDVCPSSDINFETYNFEITNTFDTEIKYLVMYNRAQPSVIWVDNMELYVHCNLDVELSVINAQLPPDSEGEIDVEVCFENESFEDFTTGDVDVLVTLPAGVNFGAGGDFSGGVATVSNLATGECVTLKLALSTGISGTFPIQITTTSEHICEEQIFDVDLLVDPSANVELFDLNHIPSDVEVYVVNNLGQAQKLDTHYDSIQNLKNDMYGLLPGLYFIQFVRNGQTAHVEKIMLMH